MVSEIERENAYRNAMRVMWLMPIKKSGAKAFKWKEVHVGRLPHSEQEIMDVSQQENDDFWIDHVLPPMRKVLENFFAG